VLPRLVDDYSHGLQDLAAQGTHNLIIEGDNNDWLRLLKSTHAGKVRVIYIDPLTTPATETGFTTTAM
jgi:adenine-specific DNA-methyltransferase